jgi:hypothetical protein
VPVARREGWAHISLSPKETFNAMEFVPTGTEIKPSGGMCRTPVIFGQYETGRSKNPSRTSPFTSPCFADGMKQGVPLPEQGDPGAYDPHHYEDAGTNPAHNSSNKNRKPFDSTEVRSLRANLFGIDTPSVGAYPVFEPEKTIGSLDDNLRYPKVDANVCLPSPPPPPLAIHSHPPLVLFRIRVCLFADSPHAMCSPKRTRR